MARRRLSMTKRNVMRRAKAWEARDRKRGPFLSWLLRSQSIKRWLK